MKWKRDRNQGRKNGRGGAGGGGKKRTEKGEGEGRKGEPGKESGRERGKIRHSKYSSVRKNKE